MEEADEAVEQLARHLGQRRQAPGQFPHRAARPRSLLRPRGELRGARLRARRVPHGRRRAVQPEGGAVEGEGRGGGGLAQMSCVEPLFVTYLFRITDT